MAKIITLYTFFLALMLPFCAQAQQPDFNTLMEKIGRAHV